MSDTNAMLAGKVQDVPGGIEGLRYPLLASPKLNGFRAHIIGGVVYSRNMKPFPNDALQKKFGITALDGLDGELLYGDPDDPRSFRKSSSAITSHDGPVDLLNFFAFDDFSSGLGFTLRLASARRRVRGKTGFIAVEHAEIRSPIELADYETESVFMGYEGVMTRDPNGPYKRGRSTAREQWLLKLKRFEDSEAVVIRIDEEMKNTNEKDASGKRTSHKAGKVGKGVMGSLQVRATKASPGVPKGTEFGVGSGFTAAERAEEWKIGDRIKFRYFPIGIKDKPIWPTFEGRVIGRGM